ncbi:NUDIX domain-containing protein [candidate division KSB1 bacterium]|nr:NUDIX domain-containing protein [candidate division KSB1 bacterium]
MWQKPAPAPQEMQREIESHWKEFAQPHQFNGRIASLDSWSIQETRIALNLSPGDYQTLIYSNHHVERICRRWGDRFLSHALGISCVLVCAKDRVPLMERSSMVGEYPNCWDVFGGHIDVTHDSGSLDIGEAMLKELEEEVNVVISRDRLCGLGMIRTITTQKPELIFCAEIPVDENELIRLSRTAADRNEYERLFFLDADEIDLYINRQADKFSPSAVGALSLFCQNRRETNRGSNE